MNLSLPFDGRLFAFVMGFNFTNEIIVIMIRVATQRYSVDVLCINDRIFRRV